jgi:hydroxymethylpyrimidine/phosphomethylpyrimidine kinase
MARKPEPEARPVTLTVAGSDSGGGAGIQADLATTTAGGAFGTSVVTAVTAQHTRGVESTHVVPPEEVAAQIDAVTADFDVAAAKTGMLATAPTVEIVTEFAAEFAAPLVVDPVMVAASGDRLLDPAAEDAYRDLLAHATLATPNVDEASALTGVDVTDFESAVEAGSALRDTGAEAALVTGGHAPGSDDRIRDVLVTEGGVRTVGHSRVETDATHGTGCTLASAVATRLAHGDDLVGAVEAGVSLVQRAVRYHYSVGEGGAVHHAVELRERAARRETLEAVAEAVDRLVAAGVSPLVPEVGMNVAGATPYAERPGETAAVEGRLTRTPSGVRPTRGVRFGASSHVARFLLSVREFDPAVRFAANCRFDDEVESALGTLDAPAVEVDRRAEPDPDEEGTTMKWVARRAFDRVDETPAAVYDRGAVGKEAMTRVVAPDSEALVERLTALAEAVGADTVPSPD